MTRRRSLLLLLPALVPALMVGSGCKKKDKTVTPTGIKIGLVLPSVADSPFYQAVKRGADEFAAERGFEILAPEAHGKVSEQTRAVEQLLQQDVSVILVRPIDAARLKPALQKARDKGVWLVSMDRPLGDVETSTDVLYNQELAGQLCADYLGKNHRGGVAMLVGPGAEDKARAAGFRQWLKEKHPSTRIIGELPGGDLGRARAALAGLLGGNANTAVFASSDELALGVLAEVRKAGGIVVSCGGHPDALAEVRKPDSPLKLTVGGFPQSLGERAARVGFRIVGNKPTPDRIELPVQPVTKDNYGSYDWQNPVPADLTVPWESELSLAIKKDD